MKRHQCSRFETWILLVTTNSFMLTLKRFRVQSFVKQKYLTISYFVTFFSSGLTLWVVHWPISIPRWCGDASQYWVGWFGLVYNHVIKSWTFSSLGMYAGNVIHEPHLPPRDKKVRHFLQTRLKTDGKILDRVPLALNFAEKPAKLKPVNESTYTNLIYNTKYFLLLVWYRGRYS